MEITINKGTTDAIIDIEDLIVLLKSDDRERELTIIRLQEYLLSIYKE